MLRMKIKLFPKKIDFTLLNIVFCRKQNKKDVKKTIL